jgi:hypothetical protein
MTQGEAENQDKWTAGTAQDGDPMCKSKHHHTLQTAAAQ